MWSERVGVSAQQAAVASRGAAVAGFHSTSPLRLGPWPRTTRPLSLRRINSRSWSGSHSSQYDDYRVLSTVFYLNENWQPGDGGELAIYDAEDQLITRVQPVLNRLVIFLSEEFPHEVLPAKNHRYSIAGWFRVNNSRDILSLPA